jgi:hypothetical protein
VEILLPPPSNRLIQSATLDARGVATVEVPEGSNYCVKVQEGERCKVAELYVAEGHTPRPLVFGEANAVGRCGSCPQAAAAPPTDRQVGASALALGDKTSCVRMADGTVRCWGEMQPLGDASGMSQPRPVRIEGLSDVEEIGVGNGHACARKRDGSVWCWGRSRHGELGDGMS